MPRSFHTNIDPASNRRRVTLLTIGIGVVVLLAALGGIAYAAVKDGGTVIHACAKSNNGQLRLDTGGGCLPSEQAVQWNQVGVQGPPGQQGSPGQQGPPGNTDSMTRNATGFISEGFTASSPVLSAAGRVGTLSFTCSDVRYTTNTADTGNGFGDRVMFYSPEVSDSPLNALLVPNGNSDHLTVPWTGPSPNRWFSILIESLTGNQSDVTLTNITGWVRGFPEFSGCSYFAYVQTSDVRSQQTVTP
jgi:hypothetical protein